MTKFVTLPIDRLNQVILALNSYCNTGEIDCADDLVAELLAERDHPQGNQEPVAWLYTDRLGGKQAFTNEPPPGMKALCQPLVYATQGKGDQEPIWYHKHWEKDDDIFYRPTDGVPDGAVPLYTHPQNLNCKSTQARLATLWGYVKAYQQPQGEQEPIFWYRPRSDGLYEGPLHKSQIERVRKESGGWVPLYTK